MSAQYACPKYGYLFYGKQSHDELCPCQPQFQEPPIPNKKDEGSTANSEGGE